MHPAHDTSTVAVTNLPTAHIAHLGVSRKNSCTIDRAAVTLVGA